MNFQKFSHILYVDSFSITNRPNEEVSLIREGLYKPKHIIYTGLMALFMQFVLLPNVLVLLLAPQYAQLIKFSFTWWIFTPAVLFFYTGAIFVMIEFFQLLLLQFYTQKYDVSVDSIYTQKKGLFFTRTKIVKLDKGILVKVKIDINYEIKYLFVYPPHGDDFMQSYGKEFSIWIYRNNKIPYIIDSLFQEEVDLFLQVIQNNSNIQIQNLQVEADTKTTATTINFNNVDNCHESNNQVARQEVQVSTMGVFDVCRFILTWVVLSHLIFLPQTLFTNSWTKYRLNKVLRNYYTDEEIKSQNIYYTSINNQLILSNGRKLSIDDYKYVHGYWIYLSFGVVAIVVILDVILGKRNIIFIKWFLEELNKPRKYKDLYVRKWQLRSAYKYKKTTTVSCALQKPDN
jgi:hypothetical protein